MNSKGNPRFSSRISSPFWTGFLRRLVFTLLWVVFLLWLVVIPGGGLLYMHQLLHVLCPEAGPPPPGFREVRLSTADGLQLTGWWHPPEAGHPAAILLLGGHAANRAAMLPEAQFLAGAGYGILTLDYRNCAGEISTLGYREVEELRAMVAFARSQPGVEWIGVLGFSVGGTVAIRGAARSSEIRALVAEGNFTSLEEDILSRPAAFLSPAWQIRRMALLAYRLYVGAWPGEVNPLTDLPKIAGRPALLIHGDTEATHNRAQAQQAACGSSCQLWIIPGAGHGAYRAADEQKYRQVILDFFDTARAAGHGTREETNSPQSRKGREDS